MSEEKPRGPVTTPAPTPGQAARDLQAERDHAEFIGWFEAQGHVVGCVPQDDMSDAFKAGMQAARDLAAAQEPHPAPASASQARRHEAQTAPAPDLARLRAELHEVALEHAQLIEVVLANAGETEDGGDAPAEELAERYVRKLESDRDELTALRSGILGVAAGLRASDGHAECAIALERLLETP